VWLVVASARAADSRKAECVPRDVKVMWSCISEDNSMQKRIRRQRHWIERVSESAGGMWLGQERVCAR
jgi:hypothetical protein